VTENALLFGEDKSLVAVVTDPEPGVGPRREGVIILNAGVLHRVGPNRIHVQLARLLATYGFSVLRFDFSGIGDSRQAAGNEPFARRAVREASQAMDVLGQQRGLKEFLLVGICAGADAGLEASIQDPRVAGAVLIDGYNLPSLGMLLYFYRTKLINPISWLRFLAGRSLTWSLMRNLANRRAAIQSVSAGLAALLPTPSQFVARVHSLAERGTDILFVYTDSSAAYYNYRRYLRRPIASWPSKARLTVEHMAHSDHLFTLLVNRTKLLETVAGWAARRKEEGARGPNPDHS
jgi:pimeloyl-ACP methyl ester carboxylesterase